MRKSKVSVVQERELKLVILADGDEGACSVKTLIFRASVERNQNKREGAYIGKQEESEQIDKGVRQLAVLLQCAPNLLPSNSEVSVTFGQLRSRARLLKNDCEMSRSDNCQDEQLANLHHQTPTNTQ